jgi:hypothetical protein
MLHCELIAVPGLPGTIPADQLALFWFAFVWLLPTAPVLYMVGVTL